VSENLDGAALRRLAARLFRRRAKTMLFLAACVAVGIAFLSAVSHLLYAVDGAVAARARDMLAGDVQASSPRPFSPAESASLAAAAAPGRRASQSVSLASMLAPARGGEAPFLVAVKAVDGAYPLRGELKTDQPGVRPAPGLCLLERSAALQHGLKVGDEARVGRLHLKIAALIDQEPDRDFLGFSFAPRLLIAREDLDRADLLGLGARVRYAWTLALGADEEPARAAAAAKRDLSRALADPHVTLLTYSEGESSAREGLRRAALFFTALALAALLLGAAGLRAGLALFLDAEAETMGLLRCLGASAAEVERLYAGLCVGAGLLGGGVGAAAGWALAALAARAAGRLGLTLSAPPRAAAFVEALALSGALAWGLSAARVRALASRPPLDALREPPPAPRALAFAGWAAAAAAVLLAAWLRAPTAKDALLLTAALAAGAFVVEILSRAGLAGAERLARALASAGLPFPARHGLRRLVRRRRESRVMLFTLAGGFALLAAVGSAREGFARALAPSQAEDAPDLFLVDVQPGQAARARTIAARWSRGDADFAPLVRARLIRVDGEALRRDARKAEGDDAEERGRWRSREYNLTYADALNPSEELVAGKFWAPGTPTAEASLERDFMDRSGLKLGSRLTFDVQGREVEAVATSVRRVEWAAMRPNFFVTLTPNLLQSAPRTYIASLRARDPAASAALRRELSRELPNVSVIDAAALLATARRTLGLILTAVGALAAFCVGVGALVVAGLVALGRTERAAENALERALGWTEAESRAADAAELLGLGALCALCAAAAGAGLSWELARRLDVPLAADPAESAALLLGALLLPALAGLLAGAASRRGSNSAGGRA
jgi:putative ABC transport system permease protein